MIEDIKGILINPLETFERVKNNSVTRTYQQYVLLLIDYSILLGIVSFISASMLFSSYQYQLGAIPVLGSFLITKLELFKSFILNSSLLLVYLWFLYLLVMIFLKGLFIHIFVILFGGEQGLQKTLLVTLFSVIPFFILGWIPYIWIIGVIWTVILFIIGIKILQNLPWWKAIAVFITPTVLIMVGLLYTIEIVSNVLDAISSLI